MISKLFRNPTTAFGFASLMLAASNAQAQSDYPHKPAALVPFAAASGTDALSRITAKHITKELGRPVNVVNKPGGISVPDATSAALNGYTLLFFVSPAPSPPHALVKDLPYKVGQRALGPLASSEPHSNETSCL